MIDDDLSGHVRKALATTRPIREVKMFGGIGFTFNGNLLVAASSRGLLVRVGKDRQNAALEKPDASLMVMRGRRIEGYIRVTGEALSARTVRAWVKMALAFVRTLPPKPSRAKTASKSKSAKVSRRMK